jgi:hypothetical protein
MNQKLVDFGKYALAVGGPVAVQYVQTQGLPATPAGWAGLVGMILVALAGLHVSPPGQTK